MAQLGGGAIDRPGLAREIGPEINDRGHVSTGMVQLTPGSFEARIAPLNALSNGKSPSPDSEVIEKDPHVGRTVCEADFGPLSHRLATSCRTPPASIPYFFCNSLITLQSPRMPCAAVYDARFGERGSTICWSCTRVLNSASYRCRPRLIRGMRRSADQISWRTVGISLPRSQLNVNSQVQKSRSPMVSYPKRGGCQNKRTWSAASLTFVPDIRA